MTSRVRVFRLEDLRAADPTPGMERMRAFELERLWAGQVLTAPGAISGWHHHDVNESSLYVVEGVLRLEFEGHEGWVDAHAGDFIHVPPGGVHGFRNTSGEPASMLLLFTPGAPREEYFETLFAGTLSTMSEEEKAAFYLRHDNYWV